MSGTQPTATPTGMAATGLGVALSRAEESARPDRLFTDRLAASFVSASDVPVVSADDAAPFVRGYFALRTRWFDDTVTRASAAGTRQFVALAAGLDTRAQRLGLPAGATVYEIDLPDAMAFKNAVLDEVSSGDAPDCRRVGLGADLRGDWTTPLLAAGLRPDEPTHWVIEGLLPYLTEDRAQALLETLSGLSAPGSSLALEHINTATLRLPHLEAMLDELDAEGAAWRSAVDDPVAWLAAQGWSARLTAVADLARELGRPVPTGMDHDVVGPARCWLAEAARPLGRGR